MNPWQFLVVGVDTAPLWRSAKRRERHPHVATRRGSREGHVWVGTRGLRRKPLRSLSFCVHAKARRRCSKRNCARLSVRHAERKAACAMICTALSTHLAHSCCTKCGLRARLTPSTPTRRISCAGTHARTLSLPRAKPISGSKSFKSECDLSVQAQRGSSAGGCVRQAFSRRCVGHSL